MNFKGSIKMFPAKFPKAFTRNKELLQIICNKL